MRTLALLAAGVALATVTVTPAGARPHAAKATVTVFAAASLTDAFPKIAPVASVTPIGQRRHSEQRGAPCPPVEPQEPSAP